MREEVAEPYEGVASWGQAVKGDDSLAILVRGFESGQDVSTYVRGMTEYSGTAGKITKEAGTGNFRSAPAVWVIKNGKPVLAEQL